MSANWRQILNGTVIVTGLGYFVDIYDMLIFNMARVISLTDLGLTGDAVTQTGIYILNLQMVGLLVGGIVWGMLSDRMGRKACLFASILIYSLGTLACGFVQDVDHYAILRLICGFGLAGEVGVGATLITEKLTAEQRGLGVGLFAAMGIFGAVAAGVAIELVDWRTAYIIGGIGGLLLLLARAKIMESGIYGKMERHDAPVGSLLAILKRPACRRKYIAGILIGVPIYFAISIMWTLAPELGRAMDIAEPLQPHIVIATGYFFMTLSGFLTALLSDWLRSRKKTVLICQLAGLAVFIAILAMPHASAFSYYVMTALLGFTAGYWTIMITLGAEQFGTNLRATASTTISNFVRAATIPMTLGFTALKADGPIMAAFIIGIIVYAIAILAGKWLEETYGKELDYIEK